MTTASLQDTASSRKARGAFFTPAAVADHIAEWAVLSAADTVLEPSAGEAIFLTAAVRRLRALGADVPFVHGVELHGYSAEVARGLVRSAGGRADISVSDFFLTEPSGSFDAVIGNPPFIRFQNFSGESRDRARFAAQAQGVALTGLASSWAAFVIHAAAHLRPGGRLGMVLPAELLSTNYAAPVRQFLLERFEAVELITFESQIFVDAEADTVLVKASGWQGEPSGVATLRQTRDASTLGELEAGTTWSTTDPSARWSPLRVRNESIAAISSLVRNGALTRLRELGEVKLGMVTGGNKFFTLSPQRVRELGIPRRDLVRVSPPGSAHLRELTLTERSLVDLGRKGAATWLLSPSDKPAAATLAYLASGHATGVDTAYKCRVRSPWWRVPLVEPADLLLTYMNADTPRLTVNEARARHLNSVHGVYLNEDIRQVASQLLPIASLNSVTLLSAELVGRSYGGGLLKLEPGEAAEWWMPSPAVMRKHKETLERLKPAVERLLRSKNMFAAVALVDEVLLCDLTEAQLRAVRDDQQAFMNRRLVRGRNG